MTEATAQDLLLVMTTAATRDDARRIGLALVERRLVACAQLSDIESLYRWQGRLEQSPECRLVLKTTVESYAAVEAAIRELHPYELPAIHAMPVTQAYGPYADWVREEIA